VTRTPLSRSKGQRSRSPGRFTHRRVNASGKCRVSVGTYWPWVTATLRSARRREALRRPQREERGGSISWRPPAYSLLLLSAPPYYVVGADIAITLSRCLRVHVSTIKRKPLIGMTCSLAQQWSSTVCQSLLILVSKGQGSGAQGHHSELLAPPSYMWNRCSFKVQILCTIMHYGQLLPMRIKNYAGIWRVSQNIIPSEKFTPAYIMRYIK